MSEQDADAVVVRAPMTARDRKEPNRTATTLELFFDLCFVVAVAQAAASLAHSVTHGHTLSGLGHYALVFFLLWWSWMTFTWFASAYDNDDVLYRIAVLIQMTGALVMAAGVPNAFAGKWELLTAGYAIMRFALISLWLRVAHDSTDRAGRTVALRYAGSFALLQIGWIGRLWLAPAPSLAMMGILMVVELCVPAFADGGRKSWHPQHITERLGLFSLIVLGETVKSGTYALEEGEAGGTMLRMSLLVAGSLLTVFSMWWMYFAKPSEVLVRHYWQSIVWGYGHYFILGSAAAVGAGIEIGAAAITHHSQAPGIEGAAVFTAATAVFIIVTWLLHIRPHGDQPTTSAVTLFATSALILASTALPSPYLATGALMTVLLVMALKGRSAARRPSSDPDDGQAA
ncbi:low temperature requirement protein A [Streptomyces sp. NPDC047023]|uniref:low temperature requirement protein A n=1 Tax=Streptomyces sp. NPDC047023 TaxID=3155139 RepID=UPI00340344AF